MNYRKEIDGLRTLAVIPVILFHAGFEWISGGYLGVDIFFVISGYLITSIIIREKTAGTFTLASFYERRARRILPALFLVMLLCLPAAWVWLLPHELENFGKSLIAVAIFAANILFWQESDYFAADADLIPLLHTWSLAVEEQFYVIFPLIVIAFWALGKRWIVGIVSIIALISLGLTEWGWRQFPEANFYLLSTRAWELMIGVFAAFYLSSYAQPNGKLAQIGSLAGLALILFSVFVLDETIPFPSLYALIPTLGAVFIILFTTPETMVYRLLSFKVMVGIGLISYSAYLWHVPLLVFARITHSDEPELWLISLLCVASLALAYISWRFVERPFRDKHRFTRKQIFSFALLGGTVFIGTGMAFILSDGAAFRWN